ncbi:MAG TPA: hypothetical protein VGL86_21775 [Polyangia bacterium]|jgi:hypothetical protein
MDKTVGTEAAVVSRAHVEPARQAYHILHWGFVAAPTIAGLDKFTHFLTNWDQYLAHSIERILPMSGHAFMLLVGVVEILAGLLVAVKPRIGAFVVAAWLVGIIVNLLLVSGFYDIALRDFGLMLAAIALARLSATYDRGWFGRTTR